MGSIVIHIQSVAESSVPQSWAAASGGRGGGGDRSPANFSAFKIMPMGGAWKESTSNGPRPPPPPPIVAPWRRPCPQSLS